MSLTQDILARCERLGFALAAVAGLEDSPFAEHLRAWLAEGRHGQMAWLARNTDIRTRPSLLMPGARSCLIVADQYAPRGHTDPQPPPTEGRIARYARGRDYHKVMKRRLHALCDELRAEHPDAAFRAFCDTAPVPERELAMRAAIAWIAKNTLAIHPRRGSWLLLAGVMTTLDLTPTPPDRRLPDHCGSCTRCIDACPTHCIEPYTLDASRCISYLTIEHRDIIDPELHEAMGNWIFGCDICQEVCPHNSPSPTGLRESVPNPAYAPRRSTLDLFAVLDWTEEDRRAAISGTPMTRASLPMLKRNAIIALANAARDDPSLRPRVIDRLRCLSRSPDEHALPRATADQALAALGAAPSAEPPR